LGNALIIDPGAACGPRPLHPGRAGLAAPRALAPGFASVNPSPPLPRQVQHTLREPPDSRRSMAKAIYVSFGLTMVGGRGGGRGGGGRSGQGRGGGFKQHGSLLWPQLLHSGPLTELAAEIPATAETPKTPKPPRLQVFYLVTGLAGYLALGDAVTPNVLASFTSFRDPATAWLPLLANVLVLVHLGPAYQARPGAQRTAGDPGASAPTWINVHQPRSTQPSHPRPAAPPRPARPRAPQVVAQPLFVGLEALLIRWFPRFAQLPEAPVRLVYRFAGPRARRVSGRSCACQQQLRRPRSPACP
jgi:hypothetical protein